MIIHSSEEDEIIQARGRVRHDIDTLYSFDPNAKIVLPVPDKYLGHVLTKDEKDDLCQYFNIKDSNAQLRKFPYIIKHLDQQLYEVNKKNGKWVIKKRDVFFRGN